MYQISSVIQVVKMNFANFITSLIYLSSVHLRYLLTSM
nr:MAG TPA: hypothetical protein [Caudoviricetes sp.]